MSKKNLNPQSTLIGIDYGEAKTGVALGRNSLATPLTTFNNLDNATLIHQIIRTALENKAEAFVLGIPLQADGKETKQSLKVRTFGKMLKVLSKKPVLTQNEYGTTEESIKASIENGVPRSKRPKNDHLAATLILRDFYKEQNDF